MPGLDGVRGVAVLGVMAFHGSVWWGRGGFLGVDSFFVLSGFLITALLVGEWGRSGSVGFRRFYVRRARRLLPALLGLLAGVAVLVGVLGYRVDGPLLRGDSFASLFYVANWRFWLTGQGYFGAFAAPSPLRHLWSLGIEEQFYLVWPVLLVGLLSRPVLRRWLLGITLAAAAGSAVLMAVLYHGPADVSRVYYGTDTRAQALLIGAALAVLLAPRMRDGAMRPVARPGRVAVQTLGVTGAVWTLWVWSSTTSTSRWLYRGGFALVALATAAVIAAVVVPGWSLLRRGLAWGPLQWIGRRSYGIYLWHWPVDLYLTKTRTGLDLLPLLALRSIVAIAIAAASYRYLEQPIRTGHLTGWRTWAWAPAGGNLTLTAIIVATLAPPTTTGLDSVARAADASHLVTASNARIPAARAASPRPAPGAPAVPRPPPRVLVVGDSVAYTLADGVAARLPGDVVVNGAVIGCPLVVDRDARRIDAVETGPVNPLCDWRARWPPVVDKLRPDVAVIMFGAWDVYDVRVGGQWLDVGSAAWRAHVDTLLSQAVAILTAQGARVVLVTNPYFQENEVPGQVHYQRNDRRRVDAINDEIRAVAASAGPSARLFDLNRVLEPGNRLDGGPVLYDGVHFSADGGRRVAGVLAPLLTPTG
ncbi:MAG TPA: acyltransferase family protein [Acidimicrobiia bacterium]|nr:acyltransferase family protein [Acidimicrobiia bacterium]